MGKRGGSAPAAATSFGSRDRGSRPGTAIAAAAKRGKVSGNISDHALAAREHGWKQTMMSESSLYRHEIFDNGDRRVRVTVVKSTGQIREAGLYETSGGGESYMSMLTPKDQRKRQSVKAWLREHGKK